MSYICGSYQIAEVNELRSYDDLNDYIAEKNGVLLGEEASDFLSFYAIDVKQSFGERKFRIGCIMDNHRGGPTLCPVHKSSALAIGMNSNVKVISLNTGSVLTDRKLDSWIQLILYNNDFLAAIHELGVTVWDTSKWQGQRILKLFCQ